MPQDDPFADLVEKKRKREEEDPFADLVSGNMKVPHSATATGKSASAPGTVAVALPDLPPPKNPILQDVDKKKATSLITGANEGLIEKATDLAAGIAEGAEGLSKLSGGGRLISPLRLMLSSKDSREEILKKVNRGIESGFEAVLPLLGAGITGQLARRGLPYLANLGVDLGGGIALQKGAEEAAKKAGAGEETSRFVGNVVGALPLTTGAGEAVEKGLRKKFDEPMKKAHQTISAYKEKADIPHSPGANWKEIDDAIVEAQKAKSEIVRPPDTLWERLKRIGSEVPPLPENLPEVPNRKLISKNKGLPPPSNEKAVTQPMVYIKNEVEAPRLLEFPLEGEGNVLVDEDRARNLLFGTKDKRPTKKDDPWSPSPTPDDVDLSPPKPVEAQKPTEAPKPAEKGKKKKAQLSTPQEAPTLWQTTRSTLSPEAVKNPSLESALNEGAKVFEVKPTEAPAEKPTEVQKSTKAPATKPPEPAEALKLAESPVEKPVEVPVEKSVEAGKKERKKKAPTVEQTSATPDSTPPTPSATTTSTPLTTAKPGTNISFSEDKPGIIEMVNDPRRGVEERKKLLKQAEDLFYFLGYNRDQALKSGLPKQSYYLGPRDFKRGAPSAKAWRELIDARGEPELPIETKVAPVETKVAPVETKVAPVETKVAPVETKATASGSPTDQIVEAIRKAESGERGRGPGNYVTLPEIREHLPGWTDEDIAREMLKAAKEEKVFLASFGTVPGPNEKGKLLQMEGENFIGFARNLDSPIAESPYDRIPERETEPGSLKFQTELPPPAEGYVRLYRVGPLKAEERSNIPEWIREDPDFKASQEAVGRWWTDDPEKANWYAREEQWGERRPKYYIDIPKEEADQFRVDRQSEVRKYSRDVEGEYFLPRETTERAIRADDKFQTVPEGTDIPTLPEGLKGNEKEEYYLSKLKESLPGFEVSTGKRKKGGEVEEYWIKTPGGQKARIIVTDKLSAPEGRATGAYRSRTTHLEPLILLTEEGMLRGTAQHEAFHWAWENLLYPKERKALLKEFGSEEAAAIAFRLKGPETNTLRNRLMALKEGLLPTAQGTMERLQRLNQSSIWARRRMGLISNADIVHKGPSIDWKALGAHLKNTLESGLQVVGENPSMYKKAVAPTVAKEKWRTIIASSGMRMAKAIQQDRPNSGWEVLRDVLVQSRFEGVKERYRTVIEKIQGMTAEEILSDKGLIGFLRAIDRASDLNKEGRRPNTLNTLALIAQEKGPEAAKDYLIGKFEGLLSRVPNLDLEGRYGKTLMEMAEEPGIQKALEIYKAEVEAPAREAFLQNEGILSNELGPLDTWYPLIPIEEGDVESGWLRAIRSRSDWVVPDNPFNKIALASAKAYDTGVEALIDRLAYGEKKNRTAEFMKYLVENRFAREGAGPIPEDGMEKIMGERIPARFYSLNSQGEELVINNMVGKEAPRWIAIPEPLANEIEHIITTLPKEKKGIVSSFIDAVTTFLNGLSLLGPFDNAFNRQSIMGGVLEGTPWLSAEGVKGKIGKLPFFKQILLMEDVYKNIKFFQTEEGQKWAVDNLIPIGAYNPRVGQVTANKRLALETGKEYIPSPLQKDYWTALAELTEKERRILREEGRKELPARVGKTIRERLEGIWGPAVYGPSGIDLAVRKVLFDFHSKVFPEAAPKQRADFVNQIGNYNWALQGGMERKIKESRLGKIMAPFITMGWTMVRNGIRTATAQPPGLPEGDPMKNMMVRLASTSTGGLLTYLLTWAGLNYYFTGVMPWEDKGKGRLGYVRIPQENLKKVKPAIESMLGEVGRGEEIYLPLGMPFTWSQKGMNLLGAKAIDSFMMGVEDGEQLFWDGIAGAITTGIHPFIGGAIPQMAMGSVGIQGWVPSFYDSQGKWRAQSLLEKRDPTRSTEEAIAIAVLRGLSPMSQLGELPLEALAEVTLDRPMEFGQMGRKGPSGFGKFGRGVLEALIPRSTPVKKNVLFQQERAAKVQSQRRRNREVERRKVERANANE